MTTDLEKVYASAVTFLTPSTPLDTHTKIIEEAVKLVDATGGSILLKRGTRFYIAYTSVPSVYDVKPRRRGFTYEVYTSNKPRIIPMKKIVRLKPIMGRVHSTSDILIPLSFQRKKIGVLAVYSKKNVNFTQKELKLLKHFAPLATLAIYNAQLRSDLLEALQTRDLFISMASHELRTPITALYTHAQLMERKIREQKPINVETMLLFEKQIRRITLLVNELLQLHNIQKGKLQFIWEQCDMVQLTKQAIKDFIAGTTYRSKVISRITVVHATVRADSNKLTQVILNLLTNAAKHSPSNSQIRVLLSKKGKKLFLEVADKGQGIHKEDLPKVFREFYRGKNSIEGMGIGLYLSKNIIKKHRGTVKVTSQINKGTHVVITLPLVV